ncbi:unnamed protein product [Linum trigynum]|uniref:Uncharacterized protein n=1 Tax=Linum trigynum TaxID=586398 RepID=A0AAV2EPJ1_9ROSI
MVGVLYEVGLADGGTIVGEAILVMSGSATDTSLVSTAAVDLVISEGTDGVETMKVATPSVAATTVE